MTESAWLCVVSALLTANGILLSLAYANISARLMKLEQREAKTFAAVVTMLMAKTDNTKELADAIHSLLLGRVGEAVADV